MFRGTSLGMHPAAIVAVTLGSCAVIQAAANRRISSEWGLAPTIFLNGSVVILMCVAFYFAARRGWVDAIGSEARLSQMQMWWVLPGVFGFLLITGLPWAVGKIGATQVFVGVVFAQMATSLIWDRLAEGLELSWQRVLGVCLCAAGVAFATRG